MGGRRVEMAGRHESVSLSKSGVARVRRRLNNKRTSLQAVNCGVCETLCAD